MGIDNFPYRCEPARVPLSASTPTNRIGYEPPPCSTADARPGPERSTLRPAGGIVERGFHGHGRRPDVEVARRAVHRPNSQRRVGLRDVARATGISLRRLQTRFKEQLGRTILQEINGRGVKAAKELLRETAKKIRVVAGECGFGNSVKMIRVFKQYEGVSPKRFRRQVGGDAKEADQPVRNGGVHD